MNQAILKKYSIEFGIMKDISGRRFAKATSTNSNSILSFDLSDLFIEGYIDGFISIILSTIQKAQTNIPYDPEDDGGPTMVSLSIGANTSIIRNVLRGTSSNTIPTNDLKEIVLSWVDFVNTNNLVQMN